MAWQSWKKIIEISSSFSFLFLCMYSNKDPFWAYSRTRWILLFSSIRECILMMFSWNSADWISISCSMYFISRFFSFRMSI